MVKTKGAIDKKFNRKTRSDLGKKRTRYAGKPCKHRKRKYYNNRKGNKKDLWIHLWWRKPMSKDGYRNWKPKSRSKVWKEVTDWNSRKPMRVPLHQIDTKSKMEEFVAINTWEGKWVVMGRSNAKNKGNSKPVKICTVLVKETPTGNTGKIVENVRLSKYSWFYKG